MLVRLTAQLRWPILVAALLILVVTAVSRWYGAAVFFPHFVYVGASAGLLEIAINLPDVAGSTDLFHVFPKNPNGYYYLWEFYAGPAPSDVYFIGFPLWLLALPLASVALLAFAAERIWPTLGLCRKCGYTLRSTSVCSECGHTAPSH